MDERQKDFRKAMISAKHHRSYAEMYLQMGDRRAALLDAAAWIAWLHCAERFV